MTPEIEQDHEGRRASGEFHIYNNLTKKIDRSNMDFTSSSHVKISMYDNLLAEEYMEYDGYGFLSPPCTSNVTSREDVTE